MSFDLQFVPRNGQALPAIESLANCSEAHPHFAVVVEENTSKLVYDNSSTGVYFTVWRLADSLELNLNYCRPSFFALETFEVMSEWVRGFLLLVNDPQEGTLNQPYDATSLLASWKKGNSFACSAFRGLNKNLLWLEESKATDLWHYLKDYAKIKEECDEYFVPQVLLVQFEGKVLRGTHLTRPTNYVIPPVDVFWLENRGVVRAERVMNILLPYLTSLTGFDWLKAVEEDAFFHTDVMDVWEAMYDSLIPDFNMDQLSRVPLDGFVDVNNPVQ